MKEFYRTGDVQKVTGASYRQLSYWDQNNFISPSYRRNTKRVYSLLDVVKAAFATEMKKQHKGTNATKAAVASLHKLLDKAELPIMELTVYWDKDRVIVYSGEMFSNISPEDSIKLKVKDLVERIESKDNS